MVITPPAGLKMSKMVPITYRGDGVRMNIRTSSRDMMVKQTTGHFEIGRSPVNYEEFAEYLTGINAFLPIEFKDPAKAKDPVRVEKSDAEDYLEWVSNRTGSDFRLPTETEWHYAVWDPNAMIVNIAWDPEGLQFIVPGRSSKSLEIEFKPAPLGSDYWEWMEDEHKLFRKDETVRVIRGISGDGHIYRKEISADTQLFAAFRMARNIK